MGWFDKTKKTTTNVTNVITETNTNIRDIGLTGAQAVQLAQTIEVGGVQREIVRASAMNSIGKVAQSTFANAANTINFVAASTERNNQRLIGSSERNAARLITSGENVIAQARASSSDILANTTRAADRSARIAEKQLETGAQNISNLTAFAQGITDTAIESAKSAQQSAFELQRQATGAPGPSLTEDPDKANVVTIVLIIGGVVTAVAMMRAFK